MYQHWNLSIDRQAEQIKRRDELIRHLWLLACTLFAIVFILAIMLIMATRVYASEACMTKAEARSKWPTAHLYWHTAEKCWNNQAHRGGHYGKRNPEEAKPHPAPPARADANGNATEKRILWPSLAPTIEFSFQSFLNAEPMTAWPPIMDIDEITANPPPECCWPKLDKDFEVRWNEMPAMWLAKLKE